MANTKMGHTDPPLRKNLLRKLSLASRFVSVSEGLLDQRHTLSRVAHIQ